MLRTNNNIMAVNVGRSITRNQNLSATTVAKLGSGDRIERAANDAAGISISEGMRSELVQLNQNVRNAETANDMLQVAEAPLQEASQILLRMKEMAIPASNAHPQDTQRDVLNSEVNQLRVGIDRMIQATRYNNDAILTGQPEVSVQVSTAINEHGLHERLSSDLRPTQRRTSRHRDLLVVLLLRHHLLLIPQPRRLRINPQTPIRNRKLNRRMVIPVRLP